MQNKSSLRSDPPATVDGETDGNVVRPRSRWGLTGHGRIDYAVCRASRGPGGLGLGEGAGDDRRDDRGRTQHDDVECNEYNNWARREGGRVDSSSTGYGRGRRRYNSQPCAHMRSTLRWARPLSSAPLAWPISQKQTQCPRLNAVFNFISCK